MRGAARNLRDLRVGVRASISRRRYQSFDRPVFESQPIASVIEGGSGLGFIAHFMFPFGRRLPPTLIFAAIFLQIPRTLLRPRSAQQKKISQFRGNVSATNITLVYRNTSSKRIPPHHPDRKEHFRGWLGSRPACFGTSKKAKGPGERPTEPCVLRSIDGSVSSLRHRPNSQCSIPFPQARAIDRGASPAMSTAHSPETTRSTS